MCKKNFDRIIQVFNWMQSNYMYWHAWLWKFLLDTPCAAGARSPPPVRGSDNSCVTSPDLLFSKRTQNPSPKEVPNWLPVLLIFINGVYFLDPEKSKAQTTKVQQPRPCLQIPFAKSNYLAGRRRRRTSVFLHYRTERALRAIINNHIFVSTCTIGLAVYYPPPC